MNVVVIVILLEVLKDGLILTDLCSHSPNNKLEAFVTPDELILVCVLERPQLLSIL